MDRHVITKIGDQKALFFRFGKKEKTKILSYLKDHLGDEIDTKKVVSELEDVCHLNSGRKPNRVERKKQFVGLYKKITKFNNETLDKLQDFAFDHLINPGEIIRSTSEIQSKLIRLESLLESKTKLYIFDGDSEDNDPKREAQKEEGDHLIKFDNGAPKNYRSLSIIKGVYKVFKKYKMPVKKSKTGLFYSVLCVCLSSLKLPHKDPSRLVNQVIPTDITRKK